MPPDRTLTDADIAALAMVLKSDPCSCPFTSDEISAVRSLLDLMHETKSSIVKGLVGVIIAGFFVVLAIGAKVWVKTT
jgi:hypothetical protein